MFRGLKNAVKGGISTVNEKGSDFAGSVVGDPDLGTSSLKNRLKEGAKNIGKGGSQFVEQGTENFNETVGTERVEGSKELAKDVVHNAKHYGAFGENFLGYSDPTKDLRKAVKAKEKAAKKAKKEKKKKGGKTEDLFDPENLAKYKAELEEKRRLAAEASPGPAVAPEVEPAVKSGQSSPDKSGSPVFEATRRESVNSWGFQKPESPDFEFESPSPSKEKVDKEEEKKGEEWRKADNWKDQLNALSSGVDDLVKAKKEKLDQIKVDSYYQRKKTQDEIDEENKVERPKTLVGKRKKKWVDLDQDDFEEYEGEIPIILSDTEDVDSVEEEKVEAKEKEEDPFKSPSEEVKEESAEEEKEEEEKKEKEEEDDIFNTQFVNETLAVLDVKLAVIPDSPEEKEEDDIFDTKYADVVVEKAKIEREKSEKVESNRIKFGCIANAADVLSGKASSVDPSNVEHAVKARSRRRPNRVNLIADEAKDVTAIKDITNTIHVKDTTKADIFEVDEESKAPEGEILAASPADVSVEEPDKADCRKLSDDLKEFDVIQSGEGDQDNKEALLVEEEEEEEDPFDAAFDEIAKESVAKAEEKTNLARLEEDLFNDDLFDTTAADDVLNLASLTKVKEKKESPVLDDFDDKDPFDTSAFEHLTKDLEEDLEFESLATRELDSEIKGNVAADLGPDDPFEAASKQAKAQKFGDEEGGWGAFDTAVERKKPPRPPPRRPPPPRPPRPSESGAKETPQVQVDYASGTNTGRNTPSVIIKAPSSESIKSWNVNQAETLILKCNIEAIEASALEDDDEDDPFDTKQFEGIVAELKEKEEDPFDTSAASKLGPSEIKELEKEEKEGKEDPFDTEFAEELVPNKGDPFSTEHVPDDDFDPFDTTVADAVIPVRAPTIDQKTTVSIEDTDFDPEASFKKAPPPKAPTKPKPAPKEDDPFFAFQEKKKEEPPAPVVPVRKPKQPSKYARVRPKTLQEKQAEAAAAEAERQRQLELERKANESSDDDFDFDPRAKTPSPVKEVPKTPESPDPFNTDGIDPFDTSVVQISG